MKVYEKIQDIPSELKFGLTIGNFDGFHRGHQELLEDVKQRCSQSGVETVVMSFVPHPITILRNQKSFLLNTYSERRELLSNGGLNFLVETAFTRDFSTLGPTEFLDKHVFNHSGLKLLFLGYDFAFGANKEGDHEFVKNYCADKDVEVIVQEKFTDSEEIFSSSLVRTHLENGETLKAKDVLGRPFFLRGRVIKGAGRGRQIGFPTANIEVDFSRMVPSFGVYSTLCKYKGGLYKSITNIGQNPTFNIEEGLNIETNIFDFNEDIYGEEIEILFFEKIRNEHKFSSVNELIKQIKADVEKRKSLDD
jgi:riboflavin kinase/FMN adenylyltransferase